MDAWQVAVPGAQVLCLSQLGESLPPLLSILHLRISGRDPDNPLVCLAAAKRGGFQERR